MLVPWHIWNNLWLRLRYVLKWIFPNIFGHMLSASQHCISWHMINTLCMKMYGGLSALSVLNTYTKTKCFIGKYKCPALRSRIEFSYSFFKIIKTYFVQVFKGFYTCRLGWTFYRIEIKCFVDLLQIYYSVIKMCLLWLVICSYTN